jgi:hypothetical protein
MGLGVKGAVASGKIVYAGGIVIGHGRRMCMCSAPTGLAGSGIDLWGRNIGAGILVETSLGHGIVRGGQGDGIISREASQGQQHGVDDAESVELHGGQVVRVSVAWTGTVLHDDG